MKKRLWKCDNGTYDTVDDDGVADQNVPEHVLAEAPTLAQCLRELVERTERGERLDTCAAYFEQARAVLARLDA